MTVAVIDDMKEREFSALPPEPQRIKEIPVQRALSIEGRLAATQRPESRQRSYKPGTYQSSIDNILMRVREARDEHLGHQVHAGPAFFGVVGDDCDFQSVHLMRSENSKILDCAALQQFLKKIEMAARHDRPRICSPDTIESARCELAPLSWIFQQVSDRSSQFVRRALAYNPSGVRDHSRNFATVGRDYGNAARKCLYDHATEHLAPVGRALARCTHQIHRVKIVGQI